LEKEVSNYLNELEVSLNKLAKDIWDHPQIALEETYAYNLLIKQLENNEFSLTKNIADISTSFIASWGKGEPIIGILGEYDALPGLSQKVSTKKEEVNNGGPGHGCGHNLLGVGSLGAVLAVKKIMQDHNIKGTIRYYGCPAEETLLGKVLMAREGVFNDLNAAITWHPMNVNSIWNSTCTAMNSFKFNFYGKAAHAADAPPEAGASALDSVILTDVGINYLREHINKDTLIHGIITKGGYVPNIVPDFSQSWYFLRAPNREQVENIYSRVINIAKGAALMCGTTFDIKLLAGSHEYIPNYFLGELMLKSMKKIGPPKHTKEENDFARKLMNSVDPIIIENTIKSSKLTREELGNLLCEKVLDSVGDFSKGDRLAGSTDVGDVSYCTPTVQCLTTCWPIAIIPHNWQTTAASGSSIGYKGMIFAAKAMALSALELMARPELLKKAYSEFKNTLSNKKYISALPK